MVHIELESPDRTARRHEPVTCGIPWPRGAFREVTQLRLFNETGETVGLQARALDHWPDGSVRWALLDWQAVVETKSTYRVEIVPDAPGAIQSPQVQVTQRETSLTIDTGAACFVIRSGGAFPFDAVTVAGQPAIDPTRTHLTVENANGRVFRPRIEQVEVVEPGPLRVLVRVKGSLGGGGGGSLCRFVAYLHFFAGLGAVRFDLTLHNPRRAGHPGNFWSLGQKGSLYIRDAALTLALPRNTVSASIQLSPEPSAPFRSYDSPLELYQDSSGGENWRGTVHVNRHHVVPNSFKGYGIRSGNINQAESGNRATPIVSLEGEGRWLALAMEYFWQNFPKAIEATSGSLTLSLFPKQYADVHELQGGEQKTHTFWASFARDQVTDEPLSWCRAPLRPHATPAWYCSTGAIPRLTPRSDDPHDLYLQLVDAAIVGDDTFEHKREAIDEYGWRNFGDIYADHEAVFHKGPNRLVSHYNNQYDPIAGCAFQFLRSGDWRWWLLMHELALHVCDIDVYHTNEDRALYSHGLYWHTWHYVDAGTSTHRAHPPRTKNVLGGGPSGGQNYAIGFLLHYFLTGNPQSRDTVIEFAQWTLDMDDGRKTFLRWLAVEDTGYASFSGSFYYHGPGRAPANCLNTLLAGYQLTGNKAFLDKGEQLIRRCIHPADNVEAHNLLDAENKWFYTMFLQALGRYLEFKAEHGQIDRMYAYARTSLRNYALWMAEHEYPYLDKPEILQYPTETWAAQDMRKSEVFEFAARVAATFKERETFLEKSRFFFNSSTTTLNKMPTHSLARPVVLLLSNGLSRSHSLLNPDYPPLPEADATYDFGLPQKFTAQKTVAIRRFKLLVTLTGAAAVIAGIVATVLILM